MIDHITLHVSNAERSIAFYTKALSPLGYIPKAHHEPTIGFGVDDGTPRSDFYISPMDDPTQQPIPTVAHKPIMKSAAESQKVIG